MSSLCPPKLMTIDMRRPPPPPRGLGLALWSISSSSSLLDDDGQVMGASISMPRQSSREMGR